MSGNTFGQRFRLTTFGESHGVALGGIIDGCPAGLPLCEEDIQKDLDRRKPTKNLAATPRRESDTVRILSGVFEGKTTGTPLAFMIANEQQHSKDYASLADVFRPGHADFTYEKKYGIRDHRGGGRSSGRETAARVAGGAVARCLLGTYGIQIYGATIALGGLRVPEIEMTAAGSRPYYAAHADTVMQWEELLHNARTQGDTLGGLVRIEAHNVPAGLGDPVFDKLDARLGAALFSVGAVKGVEIGAGFQAASMTGSQNNDSMAPEGFLTNHAGGMLGGISTGQSLVLTAAIKPIPSIAQAQHTINRAGEAVSITIAGRHDICAIPRIVPVLEAMTALVLADTLLLNLGCQTASTR